MTAVDLSGRPSTEFQVSDKMETVRDDKESKAISFSLLIYDIKQQITCKVNPDDSLWTLKRQLINNTSAKKFADGLNYGFYCPASAGRVGKYLGETRPIKEFSQKDLEDLQFRYKKKYYKNLPSNLKKLKNVNDLSHRKTFIQAINSNKMNDVIKMLNKGHDPNYQDFKTGETPMTVAILGGAPKELLVRLVEEGAHLDYRNTCEMTPVHVAAINGKVEYLKTLLELGASANYRSSDNLTPLHCLSSGTNLDTLVSCSQLLLENYSVVDVADDTGNTELHHAAKQGRVLLAKKLIIYGANVNRRNAVGNTPLHMALFNNQEEMAKKLLTYGADKWITNRANYDALAAAMTVENKQLVDYIQQFDPSQTVPIKEAPIYHSKRKPDNSRRPSMQAFLIEQQKQLQRTSNLSKQLSCPGGRSDGKADTISTGLTTPDAHDVEKIGDYISSIFGSIQDGDVSVKLSKEKPNNLLLPILENQRASSFADVRTNRSRMDSFDDFTDSEEETEIVPVVTRPKATNSQMRPATMFLNPQKLTSNTESSSSLLAFALQKHLRQNASAYSLPTQSSPLPVAKLQPKVNSQQDVKVASIKSYPKRLTNAETGLLVSIHENSSTVAERRRDPWSEASIQPASVNASSVKYRPSLKDIFPYGSVTDIATEANNALNRPLDVPYAAPERTLETSAVPVIAGQSPILEQSELPKIEHRENIYEEIPSVEVTSFEAEEENPGAFLDYSATAQQFGLDIVDGSVAQGCSSYSDEIYANIGPDGQALSYYHDYHGPLTQQNLIQTPPLPVVNLVEENGGNRPEIYASEVATRMSDAVTRSVMDDLNQSLGFDDGRQRTDSKHLWLHQQLNLQGKSQQFRHSMQVPFHDQDPGGYKQELERKLMNQMMKMEMLSSPTENTQFHMSLQQQPHAQQEQNYERQQQQHPLHHQNYPQVKQQEFEEGRSRRAPPMEIKTLPRQKHRELNQRPMTSFFESSQLSLSSLDPDDTMFDSLPGRLKVIDRNKMEKSRSVSKLNDIEGETPPPYTPFFVTKPIKSSCYRTNSNQPTINPINVPNSLNIFQQDLYKASSYQDVRNKGSPPQTNRSNYPRIPPKPPKRMSSIPSSNSSISVAPPLPPSFFQHDKHPPASLPGITPLRDEEHHVTMRGKVKSTLDIPKGQPPSRSLTSSPNRNSSFESFVVTQNEIKKKLDQLRLSSGDVPGHPIQPVEYVAPLTIVQGKTTGSDFNENRAKLERLFSGELGEGSPRGMTGHPGGFLHHDQDLNSMLKVDEATGRAYLRMDPDARLEEWSV